MTTTTTPTGTWLPASHRAPGRHPVFHR